MSKKNKFIFLSINGVLNSNLFYCEKYTKFNDLKDLGEVAFLVNSIDPITVNNLNKILEATDAKIIVLSFQKYYQYLKDVFKAIGIKTPIFDIISRASGIEIEAWLNKQIEPYVYVILDNNLDILDSQLPYFIQTNWMERGLSSSDAEQAIKILNKYD